MTYTTGQTVRWSPTFAGWYGPDAPTQVGRITGTRTKYADCPEHYGNRQRCPGPWYVVDVPGHPQHSGLYAEHQLQPA